MKKGILGIIAIMVLGMMVGGCTPLWVAGGAAAGAGSVMYVRGALETTLDATYEQVWNASLNGLKKEGLLVTQEDKQTTKGVIVS